MVSSILMAKKKTSLGMDENVEGLLCYVLGWLTGIIFLVLEKKSKFVRFHAAQSLITFVGITVLVIFFGLIPFVGWVIAELIDLAGFILWILLMYKAYKGEKYKLPWVGDYAEKMVK